MRYPVHRSVFFLGAFICLVVLTSLMHRTVNAQSANCALGTLPPGTIPDDLRRCQYLPIIHNPSLAIFDAIPIMGAATELTAAEHPDLNLGVRGYISTTATLALIDVAGPTDIDAPQLDGLFAPPRLPAFTDVYQVYDWDWSCGGIGCRGAPIGQPPVTLLGMSVSPGEAIHIPTRQPDIFTGAYKALVLYAETERITLAYTREDTAALGYLVHIENVRVDPNLLALYQALNAADRAQLPALRNGERLGDALDGPLLVAVRDTGSFLDPRSRKDWWMEY